MSKIFIIAGEASGDIIGAHLISSIKQKLMDKGVSVTFTGVGGDRMKKEGMNCLFNSSELSVMGFVEIIPSLFKIIRRMNFLLKEILKNKPDIIVTIDSPGFNFRLIKKIRKYFSKDELPIIHYVAPTVWAYNKNRINIVKELYNEILLILPFEKKYFKDMKSKFVGHPIMENKIYEYKPQIFESSRVKYNIIVMPGSRKGEITMHMPILLKAMNKISLHYDKLGIKINFFILTLPNLEKIIFEYMKDYNISYKIISEDKEKQIAIKNSSLGVIKCGTAVLELSYLNLPIIAFYKVNFITEKIMKSKLYIKYFTLPNILLNKFIIPELIQKNCNEEKIFQEVQKFIDNKDIRELQIKNFKKIINKLNYNNRKPSMVASEQILKFLKYSKI